ncbi:urease accessory protein D isoform X2 [Nymphaea colorata]|uniref:urease accessory protein D isoform X2 n=1 Tax=Nymphaea colorata TaxID=210225 RepID=UPI00129EFAF0|nr:urease accessory protein D isoform X2 [Nymphaea colorata]
MEEEVVMAASSGDAARGKNGVMVVEKVGGRSTPTRCFSRYPLKLIIPSKAGVADSDAVWVYTVSFGGGIVSGDRISFDVRIGNDCTAAIKTQSSTKVYKAIGAKCSEQILEAQVGSNALLAVLPDPVTCFAGARYSQKQIFRIVSNSNLIIVDWLTSGRHERGEKWDFSLYKSTNNIFLEGDHPLFLDSVVLEDSMDSTVADRMHNYQVTAMLILVGPKLKQIRNQIANDVKETMSRLLQLPFAARSCYNKRQKSQHTIEKPDFIASCSGIGNKDIGLVVRIMAMTTESVYKFLHQHLACLASLLGAVPYS